MTLFYLAQVAAIKTVNEKAAFFLEEERCLFDML